MLLQPCAAKLQHMAQFDVRRQNHVTHEGAWKRLQASGLSMVQQASITAVYASADNTLATQRVAVYSSAVAAHWTPSCPEKLSVRAVH